jgi:antitoxin component of RelBE/YafQ-DinJ toxin-antitoxin module
MCTVNLTLSIDDEVVLRARRRAETLGTSVNQLIREYLEQLAGKTDPNLDAAEFERLSNLAEGNRRGWTFNREEAHERKSCRSTLPSSQRN